MAQKFIHQAFLAENKYISFMDVHQHMNTVVLLVEIVWLDD
jgi:hypothetical protein